MTEEKSKEFFTKFTKVVGDTTKHYEFKDVDPLEVFGWVEAYAEKRVKKEKGLQLTKEEATWLLEIIQTQEIELESVIGTNIVDVRKHARLFGVVQSIHEKLEEYLKSKHKAK